MVSPPHFCNLSFISCCTVFVVLIRFEDEDRHETNVIIKEETSTTGIRGSTFNQQQEQRGLVIDDSGSTIDVMVVWTKKAECMNSDLDAGCTNTATTENNIRGLIDLAVAETNTAYTLSGVTTQLRLVHAYREPNYVEAATNAFNSALSSIRGTTDGVMDDVHTLRTTYGADVVAMIIDDAAYCGLAYMGPSVANMFSVTAWNCATGCKSTLMLHLSTTDHTPLIALNLSHFLALIDFSFGHEIGHNMVSYICC